MPINSAATLFGTAETPNSYHRNSSPPPPLPMAANGTRQGWRQLGGGASWSALKPLNMGRATPSKWDDAERWITSPVLASSEQQLQHLHQPQKKPKSKSGPLGHSGKTCYLNCGFGAAAAGSYTAVGSPVSEAGVVFGDAMPVDFGRSPANLPAESCIARSVSLPGWSESDAAAEHRAEQGETDESAKEEYHHDYNAGSSDDSRVVSKRDAGTQMSPEFMSPVSVSSSSLLTSEQPSDRSGRTEVKDQVLDGLANTTMVRLCKKLGTVHVKSSCLSSWDIDEEATSISKCQKEEARIAAWENLQKAKAEAAIRRLEMKLEKKRSSSMEKILRTLRMAQIKAQEMRGAISEAGENTPQQHHHQGRTRKKAHIRIKNMQMGLLNVCFTCHAF